MNNLGDLADLMVCDDTPLHVARLIRAHGLATIASPDLVARDPVPAELEAAHVDGLECANEHTTRVGGG